jgi:hypothetical protein
MKTDDARPSNKEARSEFLDALKKGVLLGVAILAVAIPVMRFHRGPALDAPPRAPVAQQPTVSVPPAPAGAAARRLADFGAETPSPEALHVANWAVFTGDNGKKAIVMLDKKAARAHVFEPNGKLKASTPVLLGASMRDENPPGVGDKPLAEVKPDEKVTAAGRYIAEPGINASGEDVIWIDYKAALSMHRVRALVKEERRLERLASPTIDDNRISFGCVNFPVAFYEGILSPTVKRQGAVIYVLPETRTPQQVFGSYDVTRASATVAQAAGQQR